MVDASCNISDKYDGTFLDCSGFHGVKSLTEESGYSELAGVTMEIFKYLLALLPLEDMRRKMSQSDRLLLFLMKMKIGLIYSALGVLFGIHRTTASRT